MNPDKMTPEQMAEFIRNQNYTFKVVMTGDALDAFMSEFNAFQEELFDELVDASQNAEANAVIARIMKMK